MDYIVTNKRGKDDKPLERPIINLLELVSIMAVHMGLHVPLIIASPNMEAKSTFWASRTIKIWLIIKVKSWSFYTKIF